ncbi:fibroleukin-like [Saccostrea cucullata]|uniref:fibroleukin-like n=1 Tax=Saccostrea cuccullata TaxID=36930 RepID=UPI002ED02810
MDCKELHENGQWQSGVYDIYPPGTRSLPLKAYCDMSTMGGGWTAIQKRISGSLSFKQSWSEYKNGFGTPDQNVWIGNDAINQLTKRRNSFLYVSITLVNGTTLYELYDQFSVSDETQKYQLFLGGPATGTLGDSMLNTTYDWGKLSGMYFSTKDRDNDRYSGRNCAAHWGGGWWFNECHEAFLNGPWYPEYWRKPWNPTVETIDQTSETYIRETKMMIKRH